MNQDVKDEVMVTVTGYNPESMTQCYTAIEMVLEDGEFSLAEYAIYVKDILELITTETEITFSVDNDVISATFSIEKEPNQEALNNFALDRFMVKVIKNETTGQTDVTVGAKLSVPVFDVTQTEVTFEQPTGETQMNQDTTNVANIAATTAAVVTEVVEEAKKKVVEQANASSTEQPSLPPHPEAGEMLPVNTSWTSWGKPVAITVAAAAVLWFGYKLVTE